VTINIAVIAVRKTVMRDPHPGVGQEKLLLRLKKSR